MDVKRVKQILSSPANIPVSYNGVSVWIESCDEGNAVAQVHDITNPHETVQVNVSELQE
ncbi:H-type small acid-soluble spore protein [Ectobacillus sp. JY-23]|uniref:H-type small acid-soluble spore protein n=1 Tax=Ectobacillus sp. JY-23 TaxID=2933872 RepID=UPI001FF4CEC8|nr:H-type small acid-soluble spore protein [Ectobacillus sp. JY-23]UOY91930.1 H-type small acid-soluble spore protein [Ectobacillus sp. JY-23]